MAATLFDMDILGSAADGLLRRKQLEATLVARCWEDDGFRRRLLADPKGTIAEAFGLSLPASLSVTVREEAADALVLCIPARPTATGELSDLELEGIAGGKGLPAVGGFPTKLPDLSRLPTVPKR